MTGRSALGLLGGLLGATAATLVLPLTAGGSPQAITPKPPTAASCPPPFAMDGGFTVTGPTIQRTYPESPYHYKCLYFNPTDRGENFVIFFDIVPAGVPGTIASGDCSRTRADNPPFFYSRKRYLTVSGGTRREGNHAVGGDLKIIQQALALAEAQAVGAPCSLGTPSPPPATKPPPPTGKSTLGLDYAMPARYGLPAGGYLLRAFETAAAVRPPSWRVYVTWGRKDGQPCQSADIPAVRIDGKRVAIARRIDRCTVEIAIAEEGRYELAVDLTAGGKVFSGTRSLLVQDWLVFGLGDSNGSGEGAPNNAAVLPQGVDLGASAVWQSRQCHRSSNSYQALAIDRLEKRDRRTSVTFVHLACSGASIVDGLLGAYDGIEPKQGTLLAAQVAELQRMAGRREVDAVVISIGVNDLRFGALVKHCITRLQCPNKAFDPEENAPGLTLKQWMGKRLRELPLRFADLAVALKRAGVKPNRVYLTEYFDSTRDRNGRICDPLIGSGPVNLFTRAEAQWAYANVLAPLNKAVEAAAKEHNWKVIRGAATGFRTRGYCAKEGWIVQFTQSAVNQLNVEGTLHATVEGNQYDAALADSALRASLYAGGSTRPPER